MRSLKKLTVLLLSAALAVSLWGCDIPVPGFADYDVSAYIKALLDSSYHDDNGELMEIASISEDKAKENNTATVENAAVRFCNTYGISPSDDQLRELQVIMKQAFALTRYTVKDERKVDTGYYLEVEIAAITNFESRQADIDKLKTEAQQEASAINNPKPAGTPESSGGSEEDGGGEDGGEDDGEEGEEESSGPSAPAPAESGEKVDPNDLFVEKVLEFCIRELNNVSYDPETRTVPLDILQTEKGELQLDLNQIETLDQNVVRF